MRARVLLAGPDLTELLALTMAMGPTVAPTVIETEQPVASLRSRPASTATAAIVLLQGCENVAELRELQARHADTHFLLLSPVFPPHAAVARVVAEAGGVLLRRDESPVVIAATLVALLAGRREAAVS